VNRVTLPGGQMREVEPSSPADTILREPTSRSPRCHRVRIDGKVRDAYTPVTRMLHWSPCCRVLRKASRSCATPALTSWPRR